MRHWTPPTDEKMSRNAIRAAATLKRGDIVLMCQNAPVEPALVVIMGGPYPDVADPGEFTLFRVKEVMGSEWDLRFGYDWEIVGHIDLPPNAPLAASKRYRGVYAD